MFLNSVDPFPPLVCLWGLILEYSSSHDLSGSLSFVVFVCLFKLQPEEIISIAINSCVRNVTRSYVMVMSALVQTLVVQKEEVPIVRVSQHQGVNC